MAGPPAKPTLPRKRNRKRKRRAVSSSSSSSDSSDESDDVHSPQLKPTPRQQSPPKPESSSSDDSSSDSDSEDSESPAARVKPRSKSTVDRQVPREEERRSPSPTPPPSGIPPFLPASDDTEQNKQSEQILKDRFRKFWMASVADAFKDDLEDIRKEPNLTTSRLALLIDSLASGAEVFTSSRDGSGVNEMEVVLENASSTS